jgi:hypothetical protein
VTRAWLLPAVGLVLAMAVALPEQAQAAPERSGDIVTGLGGTQRAIGWPGYAVQGECEAAADCLAWLESGCDPALAGREPAVMASIVDVAELADGETPRRFELSGSGQQGLRWGQVLVQFWRTAPPNMYPWFNCNEIQGTRFLTGYEGSYGRPPTRIVPLGAKWMTVTSNFDNIHVGWRLH